MSSDDSGSSESDRESDDVERTSVGSEPAPALHASDDDVEEERDFYECDEDGDPDDGDRSFVEWRGSVQAPPGNLETRHNPVRVDDDITFQPRRLRSHGPVQSSDGGLGRNPTSRPLRNRRLEAADKPIGSDSMPKDAGADRN